MSSTKEMSGISRSSFSLYWILLFSSKKSQDYTSFFYHCQPNCFRTWSSWSGWGGWSQCSGSRRSGIENCSGVRRRSRFRRCNGNVGPYCSGSGSQVQTTGCQIRNRWAEKKAKKRASLGLSKSLLKSALNASRYLCQKSQFAGTSSALCKWTIPMIIFFLHYIPFSKEVLGNMPASCVQGMVVAETLLVAIILL